MRLTTFARAGLVGLLCTAAGCSSDETAKQIASMNTSNIKRLANMYAGYQNSKNGAGPKDEAEFKAFIKIWDPLKLKAMSIDADNLDKHFVSDRDNQPFKLRYGVGGGRGFEDPVVFETAGKDGKKQVGFTGGRVEEVDDATYKDLLAGKKSSAAPATAPLAPPTGTPAGGGRPGGSGPPPGAPTGPPR